METGETGYEDDIIQSITSLAYDTEQLDRTLDDTARCRSKIVEKLMKAVDDVEISPNTMKPMELESRISVLRTANEVLDRVDKQQFNRVKVKSQLDMDQSDRNTAAAIADMFNRITESNLMVDEDKIDDELDKIKEEHGIEINDTELRVDPNDIE